MIDRCATTYNVEILCAEIGVGRFIMGNIERKRVKGWEREYLTWHVGSGVDHDVGGVHHDWIALVV